jgi:hypothetical protein
MFMGEAWENNKLCILDEKNIVENPNIDPNTENV